MVQQVHAASNVGENPVVYKVKPEHDPKGKLRFLHRKIAVYYDDLFWAIIIAISDKTANLLTLNHNKNHLDKFFFFNDDCTQKLKENGKTYNRAPRTIFGIDAGNVRSKINTGQQC